MKTAVTMFIVLVLAAMWAVASDLEKEVNSFQVQLVSKKSYLAQQKKKAKQAKAKLKKSTSVASYATPSTSSKKMVATKKVKKAEVEMADEAIKLEPQYFSEDLTPSTGGMTYTARPEIKKSSSGLFVRATALPQFMMSVFDGGDDSNVSPRGLSDSMKSGFSGSVTMDLNLFKHENLVVESGVAFMQMGAKTGIKQNTNQQPYQQQYVYTPNVNLNNNGITYEDELVSQYLGVVIAGKWMFAGQESSSLYIRGGVLPMFLMNKTYGAGTGYSPYTPYNYGVQITQNNDSRFGSISTFDIAAQVGIGYSYMLTRDFNIVADITGTQGFLPVMGNYSIYNAAIGAGIGISYRL